MDLQCDDFALFGVERRFKQDINVLSERWKRLQREVHPDRSGAHDDHSKRLAMQWSARINEAYQRLKNPVARAAYCCHLAGIDTEARSNAALPPDFLLLQMQWRETLEGISSGPELETFSTDMAQNQTALLQQLDQAIDVEQDFEKAFTLVQKLRFTEKLLEAAEEKYDSFAN